MGTGPGRQQHGGEAGRSDDNQPSTGEQEEGAVVEAGDDVAKR
jgi:hypothetical protein